jgi:hypothetical protein
MDIPKDEEEYMNQPSYVVFDCELTADDAATIIQRAWRARLSY